MEETIASTDSQSNHFLLKFVQREVHQNLAQAMLMYFFYYLISYALSPLANSFEGIYKVREQLLLHCAMEN